MSPFFIYAFWLTILLSLVSCRRSETLMPAPAGVPLDPWKEAALKVERDRGEPIGRAAQVEIPDQVKHYSDQRRFLAIQIAESRKHRLQTPADFAELIQQLRGGELVEVPAVTTGYVLYGVGLSATEDRFNHYDPVNKISIPLFASAEELKTEQERINQSLMRLTAKSDELKRQLGRTRRRDRELRAQLNTELRQTERDAGLQKRQLSLLKEFYTSPRADLMHSEYELIRTQAEQYGKAAYRLDDPASRRSLKGRLLSSLRPAALRILEGLGKSYAEKFDRPLPISSLVRTEEYQRHLHATNPNATLVETPPHTTGLAFDILYKFMTAAEQTFLMAELAKLRDAGRIEALRENNDSFHVFAFLDGYRPEENFIEDSLAVVGPLPQPAAKTPDRKGRKTKPQTRRRRSRRGG